MERAEIVFEDGQKLGGVIIYRQSDKSAGLCSVDCFGGGTMDTMLVIPYEKSSELNKFAVSAKDFYENLIERIAEEPNSIQYLRNVYFDDKNISKALGKETSLGEEILSAYQLKVADDFGRKNYVDDQFVSEVENNINLIVETCKERQKGYEDLKALFKDKE